MELRCFISYSTETSRSLVEDLREVLHRLGVEPISHEHFLFGPGSDVLERIRSSDFLIAILGGTGEEQILLETGIALGLSRPVLLVRESESEILPSLAGLPQVLLGDADPVTSLRFQLDVFLETVKPSPAPRRSPRRSQSRSRRFSEGALRDQSESSLIVEVGRLLEIAGGTVVTEPRESTTTGRRPDLAVWFKDFGSGFNPILVEVKRQATRTDEEAIVQQLNTMLRERELRLGLLVTLEPTLEHRLWGPHHPAEAGSWRGIIDVLSLRQLRESVVEDTLLARLRSLRAELLHGAG